MTDAPSDFAALRRDMTDLSGRVAYVVGAGTGHGRAAARLMAAAGATVFAGHKDLGLATSLAAEIEAEGGRAVAAGLDVTSEASVLAWFEAARDVGPPDILVNSATNVGAVPFVDTGLEFWDRMHAINLRGAFLCMREAIKAMLATGRGGLVLNITTIGSIRAVRYGNAAYSSSKAGLDMLMRNAVYEHARDGIRVNTLAPGAILTEDVFNPDPANRADLPQRSSPDRSPGGQGQTADIAMAALFLAGPGGRYINGQTIIVDGGYMVT